MQRKTEGYRTNLGEYFRARGEYEHYLAALRMSTPILDKARGWLSLPTGWDLRKSDLEFHQVLKKRQLKKFKKEIIRLVEQRKASAAMQYNTVPCAFPGPLGSVPHHHGTHAAPLQPVNFATAPLVAPVQAEAIPAGTSYGVSKLPHLVQ